MLAIKKKQSGSGKSRVLLVAAVVMLGGGTYLLTLLGAPIVSPIISMQQFEPNAIAKPSTDNNRIIIPKIGVDIHYSDDDFALDNGALWRFPERGDPSSGGNFIIAAHRFTLAPTPQETIRKSPFYHIEKLAIGDEIIVDYQGKRFGYTVSKVFDVKPHQTEIEAADVDDRLTLYSCGLGGALDSRIVLFGEPLGEVTVNQNNNEAS